MSEQIADATLLSIIQAIYESLTDPSGGIEILALLRKKLGAESAFYLGVDSSDEVNSAVSKGIDRSVLLEPEFIESISAALAGLGQGALLEIDLNSKRTDWQIQLSDVLGCDGTLLLLCLVKDRQRCLVLGLDFISSRTGDVEQAHRVLLTLAPHLQLAIMLQRRTALERERADRLEGLFKQSPVARVIVDTELRITEHNAAFERLIHGSRAPVDATDGYLTIASPEFRSEIDRLIQNAAQHTPTTNITWIKDSDMSMGWLLRVDLIGARLVTANPFLQTDALQNAKYMLSFHEVGNQNGLNAGVLSAIFGLSTAEAELACELAKGSAPAEIAQLRGVAKNTVHNQLTSIMARHGFHRQGQLINLLSTLPFFL